MSTSDENAPLTRDELEAFVTPTANEVKQSREGLEAADPPTPVEESNDAIDGLAADYDYETLENCLPEKGHAALLTLRRAELLQQQTKPDADKPDYTGERGKPRSGKSAKRQECANKPTHTGAECKPIHRSLCPVTVNRGTADEQEASRDDRSAEEDQEESKPAHKAAKENKTGRIVTGKMGPFDARLIARPWWSGSHPKEGLTVDEEEEAVKDSDDDDLRMELPNNLLASQQEAKENCTERHPTPTDSRSSDELHRASRGAMSGLALTLSSPTAHGDWQSVVGRCKLCPNFQPLIGESRRTYLSVEGKERDQLKNDVGAVAYTAGASATSPDRQSDASLPIVDGHCNEGTLRLDDALVSHKTPGRMMPNELYRLDTSTDAPLAFDRRPVQSLRSITAIELHRMLEHLWCVSRQRLQGECLHMNFRGPWPVRSLQGNREEDLYLPFARRNGIILKTTSSDEPRSNPVAERDHRTSEEMEMAEWAIRMVSPIPVGKYKGCLAWVRLWEMSKAEDDETQFAPGLGNEDGLRYEDVCLFTRVLRKPEKQLRLIPQIVEARRKEVQGLYDAKCLQWATWDDAKRDNIKPIRTGFVDAIKVDEATGKAEHDLNGDLGYLQSTVDACVFYLKGTDDTFPPALAYDERQLQAAKFRFTDKGEVEVFCGVQFKRIEASTTQSRL
eukprot:g4562.t1